MRSLFYDIHRTVMNTVERSEYSILSPLRILGTFTCYGSSYVQPS